MFYLLLYVSGQLSGGLVLLLSESDSKWNALTSREENGERDRDLLLQTLK